MYIIINDQNIIIASCDIEPNIADLETRGESYTEIQDADFTSTMIGAIHKEDGYEPRPSRQHSIQNNVWVENPKSQEEIDEDLIQEEQKAILRQLAVDNLNQKGLLSI